MLTGILSECPSFHTIKADICCRGCWATAIWHGLYSPTMKEPLPGRILWMRSKLMRLCKHLCIRLLLTITMLPSLACHITSKRARNWWVEGRIGGIVEARSTPLITRPPMTTETMPCTVKDFIVGNENDIYLHHDSSLEIGCFRILLFWYINVLVLIYFGTTNNLVPLNHRKKLCTVKSGLLAGHGTSPNREMRLSGKRSYRSDIDTPT